MRRFVRRVRNSLSLLPMFAIAVAVVFSFAGAMANSPKVKAAAGDAKVIQEVKLDPHMLELTVQTPLTDWPKKVQIIVPDGWSKTADRKWPAVWLLHGGGDDYKSWLTNTDIEEIATKHDVMVVVPDSSRCSNYSDWNNYGAGGKPAWETYITEELRFLMDHNYNADGSNAAIAGLSMGGLGSSKFAERHPDMFKGVAAFSGNLDPLHDYDGRKTIPNIPGPGCIVDWRRIWGDFRDPTEVKIWERNDPYINANLLAPQKYVYISSGDGLSNPLNGSGMNPDLAEQEINREAHAFVTKLQSLNIPVDYHFYTGNHSWPYWQEELHRAWPGLLKSINVE